MKKLFKKGLLFWPWLVGLSALAPFNQAQAEPDQQIPVIEQKMQQLYDIYQQNQQFNGKTFRIFVAKPKASSAQPLPVLYTLDANAQFPLAVNAVDANKTLPLIVGIGYDTDKAYAIELRTRDYTPAGQGEEFAKGGQAADFLQFIRQQLKPWVEENYAIDRQNQYFFGHSFGGLFGLYVLFNAPDLFQYYTIASPSLWWDNSRFLPAQKPWIAHSPKHILLTLGEYEENPQADPNLNAEQLKRIESRKQMRQLNAHQLADELQAQGEKVDFYLIPQQNHGGSIPYAIQASVQWLQDHR